MMMKGQLDREAQPGEMHSVDCNSERQLPHPLHDQLPEAAEDGQHDGLGLVRTDHPETEAVSIQ